MAKRNTKMNMAPAQPTQPKKRAQGGKQTGKSKGGGSARAYSRPAQTPQHTAAAANVMPVRIAAIVVAAAALIGGTAWYMSLAGSYETAEIIGLIALAFLVGLGLAVAVRTEEIIKTVQAALRNRR